MATPEGIPRIELTPQAKASEGFRQILEGTDFVGEPRSRSKTRSISFESEDTRFVISQTNWIGGHYGNESLSAFRLDIKDSDSVEVEHLHLQDGVLTIGGQPAGQEGWALLDKLLEDIKQLIEVKADEH